MTQLDNVLPVTGGATGGILTSFLLPSPEQLVATVILGIVGAIVGYFVKLGLDCIFKKKEK